MYIEIGKYILLNIKKTKAVVSFLYHALFHLENKTEDNIFLQLLPVFFSIYLEQSIKGTVICTKVSPHHNGITENVPHCRKCDFLDQLKINLNKKSLN